MNNTLQNLELEFRGADGTTHIFRINNLLNEITVAKVNNAFSNISQSGSFFDDNGAYYAVPVEARVVKTTTETIVTM